MISPAKMPLKSPWHPQERHLGLHQSIYCSAIQPDTDIFQVRTEHSRLWNSEYLDLAYSFILTWTRKLVVSLAPIFALSSVILVPWLAPISLGIIQYQILNLGAIAILDYI